MSITVNFKRLIWIFSSHKSSMITLAQFLTSKKKGRFSKFFVAVFLHSALSSNLLRSNIFLYSYKPMLYVWKWDTFHSSKVKRVGVRTDAHMMLWAFTLSGKKLSTFRMIVVTYITEYSSPKTALFLNSLTVKTKALRSFETSVTIQSTWRDKREDLNLILIILRNPNIHQFTTNVFSTC